MIKILLDSSAIIAVVKQEVGYQKIEDLIPYTGLSLVKCCEIVSSLINLGFNKQEIGDILNDLTLNKIPYTEEIAIEAGLLRTSTKHLGLSLGDRACIATAIKMNLVDIYTTDKAWKNLEGMNININLLR